MIPEQKLIEQSHKQTTQRIIIVRKGGWVFKSMLREELIGSAGAQREINLDELNSVS